MVWWIIRRIRSCPVVAYVRRLRIQSSNSAYIAEQERCRITAYCQITLCCQENTTVFESEHPCGNNILLCVVSVDLQLLITHAGLSTVMDAWSSLSSPISRSLGSRIARSSWYGSPRWRPRIIMRQITTMLKVLNCPLREVRTVG